mgnify:CR=1 FL=1
MPDPVLSVRNISKSFGTVRALTDVSFDVRAGEVHALMGENGAGKSTLMKILAGVHQPDGGSIRKDGLEIAFASPGEALESGISTVFQELSLLANLTIAENMATGRTPATS